MIQNLRSGGAGTKKAQACIGLSLSDSMFENVGEYEIAKEMWETIAMSSRNILY